MHHSFLCFLGEPWRLWSLMRGRKQLTQKQKLKVSKVSGRASEQRHCALRNDTWPGLVRACWDTSKNFIVCCDKCELTRTLLVLGVLAASRVSLPQIARVLSEVYGDRMASQSSGSSDGESFPLQQKLLVCCLLLLIKNAKYKEIGLGKVRRWTCDQCF